MTTTTDNASKGKRSNHSETQEHSHQRARKPGKEASTIKEEVVLRSSGFVDTETGSRKSKDTFALAAASTNVVTTK